METNSIYGRPYQTCIYNLKHNLNIQISMYFHDFKGL